MARAKARDAMAFGELILKETQWAYATARAITNSPGEAEDVFQDAVLRAWQQLHKLRDPASWQPWFRRIVVRTAIDARRKHMRRIVPAVWPAAVAADHADGVADQDHIGRHLLELSPIERAVVVLRFGHDLQVRDVARLTGQPAGTTKSHLHRGVAKLRASIANEKELEEHGG